MLETSQAPAGARPWSAPIERLGACPACDSSERRLVYGELRDVVFGVSPGTWTMFECRACRTLYLDPRPTRESILIAYESYFTHENSDGDSLFTPRTLGRRLINDYLAARFGYALPNREPFGRLLLGAMPVRRRRCERLVRDLAAPPRDRARLLDVGCGNGEFLTRMREIGWSVTGQDLDPKAAIAAKNLGIEVVVGPLAPSAFRERFDAITMHHVIEHVHQPVEILSACRELLVPGGKLWVATPNADSLGRRRYGEHWHGLDCPRHLMVFSREGLDRALERAGFGERRVTHDLGMYGMFTTTAALHRRLEHGRSLGRVEAYASTAVADAIALVVPSLREELLATASV